MKDYAEHNVTAILSPPQNPLALAKNLLLLLEDDELRIRLAKKGQEHINQFTWENSGRLLEEFITTHIGEKENAGLHLT